MDPTGRQITELQSPWPPGQTLAPQGLESAGFLGTQSTFALGLL
jgi:hypothetical protein